MTKTIKNPIVEYNLETKENEIVGYREAELLFETKHLYACYEGKYSYMHRKYEGIDTKVIVLRVKPKLHKNQSVVCRIKASILKRKQVQQIINNFDTLAGKLKFKKIEKMSATKQYQAMDKFKQGTYNACFVNGILHTRQDLSQIIRGYLPFINYMPRVKK